MSLNKDRLYITIYILLALLLGYWYNTYITDFSNLDPSLRYIIRLLFGLGYLTLAIIYCKLSKKNLHLQVVSEIYLLSELSILALGLFRYFIADIPIVVSLYSTLFELTVSPLGLFLAHVIISLNTKKSLLEL